MCAGQDCLISRGICHQDNFPILPANSKHWLHRMPTHNSGLVRPFNMTSFHKITLQTNNVFNFQHEYKSRYIEKDQFYMLGMLPVEGKHLQCLQKRGYLMPLQGRAKSRARSTVKAHRCFLGRRYGGQNTPPCPQLRQSSGKCDKEIVQGYFNI